MLSILASTSDFRYFSRACSCSSPRQPFVFTPPPCSHGLVYISNLPAFHFVQDAFLAGSGFPLPPPPPVSLFLSSQLSYSENHGTYATLVSSSGVDADLGPFGKSAEVLLVLLLLFLQRLEAPCCCCCCSGMLALAFQGEPCRHRRRGCWYYFTSLAFAVSAVTKSRYAYL